MASFAPWSADDRFRVLYDARQLDFSGTDVRVGITRGGTLRGEFAFLYVRKRIDEGSSLVDFRHRRFAIGPFGTIARRVQVGLVMAAGAGLVSGTATRTTDQAAVEAQQVLRVFAQPRQFQPLARAELAIAVAVAPGAKLRISGGFDWPGQTQLGVTAMYFFGD
jgi:hypothetical protein